MGGEAACCERGRGGDRRLTYKGMFIVLPWVCFTLHLVVLCLSITHAIQPLLCSRCALDCDIESADGLTATQLVSLRRLIFSVKASILQFLRHVLVFLRGMHTKLCVQVKNTFTWQLQGDMTVIDSCCQADRLQNHDTTG